MLVRQYVKDVNVDWINIILGMQYGAVPSVNSMRALYNFQDKPWIVCPHVEFFNIRGFFVCSLQNY